MKRLTKPRLRALLSVACEFYAGHDPEMVRAIGLAETVREAEALLYHLGGAITALRERVNDDAPSTTGGTDAE